MRRSERFIEELLKYRVVIEEDERSFENYMQTRGRLGVGKILDEGAKVRALLDSVIETELGTLPLTYTELARLRLHDVMELMEIRKFRYSTHEVYSAPPLFARAGFYGGFWAYVDIKGAYYSIYKYFLNAKYMRFKYLSDAVETPFLNISMSKRVRNSVFGVMRSRHIRRYTNEGGTIKFRWVEIYHPLLNHDLVNLTYDVLQSVAWYAVHVFDAVYFNTDGCIIRADRVDEYIKFLKQLGFETGIKVKGQGCSVLACNTYSIGDFKTETFKYVRVARDFSNLVGQDVAEWTLRKYRQKIEKVL